MNHGCPCPGIGDAALGVTDTVLHFIYNAVVTSAIIVPFWFVVRNRHRRDRSHSTRARRALVHRLLVRRGIRCSASRSMPTSTA